MFEEAAGGKESDDDGFVMRKDRKHRKDSAEAEAEQSSSEAEPESKGKTPRVARLVTDKELLARFYGDDSNLDKTEKFLRNYILEEGWRGKS